MFVQLTIVYTYVIINFAIMQIFTWVYKMLIKLQFLEKYFAYVYVSCSVYSKNFSVKILCCILHKHEVFHLCASEGVPLERISARILCCILHKHEAFRLWESGDVFLSNLYLKIVCYKLHKHKTFHMCVSGDDDLSYF